MREIVGSTYPEKPSIDGFQHRKARLSDAVERKYSVDKGLSENKNGQANPFLDCPLWCPAPGS